MTDRAEPGVTPLTCDPYRDEREHERQSNAGSHLFDSACYFCLRDFWMQHEEDTHTLDAATPRPGLVEAAQALVDEWDAAMAGDMPLNGHYQKQALDRLRAALASGTGEPGLDVERLARSLRALEARDELTVADGFLGGRDAGDYVTFATSIAAAYANDKGADPTPEEPS